VGLGLGTSGATRANQANTDLPERGLLVLGAVVRDYIARAEPVGSRTITRLPGLDVSPATIRAVMADLESLGYLEKPHSSAGRIPTSKAYRFYVDCLLEVDPLPKKTQVAVRRAYQPCPENVDDLMLRTGQVLHRLTHHAAVVASPKLSSSEYRQIRFIRLREDRVLAVLVTGNGEVQNRVLTVERPVSQDELDKASMVLDHELSGATVTQVRRRLHEALLQAEAERDALRQQAFSLAEQAMAKEDPGERPALIVEGQEALFDAPEFADHEKLRSLLKMIETRRLLLSVLERAEDSPGIQIFVGAEAELLGGDLSVVVSPYRRGDQVLGALGVIGPTRMNYARVVASLSYTAAQLSRAIEA